MSTIPHLNWKIQFNVTKEFQSEQLFDAKIQYKQFLIMLKNSMQAVLN